MESNNFGWGTDLFLVNLAVADQNCPGIRTARWVLCCCCNYAHYAYNFQALWCRFWAVTTVTYLCVFRTFTEAMREASFAEEVSSVCRRSETFVRWQISFPETVVTWSHFNSGFPTEAVLASCCAVCLSSPVPEETFLAEILLEVCVLLCFDTDGWMTGKTFWS